MGLDLSHGNFHMTYSGFHNLRVMIANSLGVNTDEKNLYREYDGTGNNDCAKLQNHPIYPFMIHSDCDGEMQVDELIQAIPILESIAAIWIESNSKYFLECLITSMKCAIETNEPLEFR